MHTELIMGQKHVSKNYFLNFLRLNISLILMCIVCFHNSLALNTILLENLCNNTAFHILRLNKDLSSGILKTDSSGSWSINVSHAYDECSVIIVPEARSSVVLSFKTYSIKPEDQLLITDNDKHKFSLHGEGEFKDERKSYISGGSVTLHYMRYRASHHKLGGGFQLTFTQVNVGHCLSTEFQCQNQNCIPKNLTCDGHNHCGDNSDQKDCNIKPNNQPNISHQSGKSTSTAAIYIILVSISSVIVLVITIVFAVYAIKLRKKKAAKQTHEAAKPASGNATDVTIPTIYVSGTSSGSAPSLHHHAEVWNQPPTAPGFEEGHSNAGFSKH